MVIGITAAVLIAMSIGVAVILLAAAAMVRRSVELEPGLEEQPIEQWTSANPQMRMSKSSTQLHLS